VSVITRRGFLQGATAAAVGTTVSTQRVSASADLFLRSPNIQNVSADSAALIWTLPMQTAGSVVITDPSGSLKTFEAVATKFDAASTGMGQTYYQYRAVLQGLTPDTAYLYRIQAGGQPLACSLARPLQFRTAQNGPFSFLHLADCGTGTDQELQLSRQMSAEQVSFALANGDLAYELATYDSVETNYYGVYREQMAQVPFFASLGNHEYYTASGQPSLAARITPTDGIAPADWGRYYSFDWGNAHFVALDSNAPLTDAAAGAGQMLEWLEADLASTRKFWRIAFFHHPGYATGHHQDEPEAALVRKYIVPILEAHGVQLVFNGHEHTYQRTYELLAGQVVAPNSGGLVYITSGGGGTAPYWTPPNDLIAQSIGMNNYVRADVSSSSLTLHARGLGQDSDIDSVVLAPKPQLFAVVNVACFTPDVASGGAIAIFGRNLCPMDRAALFQTPMVEAESCSVTLNGVAVPLLYAGATQMNVQIPFGFSGAGTLAVQTPNGSAQTAVRIDPIAPGLFANPAASEIALAIRGDWSLIDASKSANTGEMVTLFLTGLGPVNADVEAGVLPPGPIPVAARVGVMFGDSYVDAVSATLNAAALYQVQVKVPPGLASKLVPVKVIANGVSSNTRSLPIA